MGNRRKSDGLVATHRVGLPRQRKSLRLDLRMTVYEKLLALSKADDAERPVSLAAVVERLILESAT